MHDDDRTGPQSDSPTALELLRSRPPNERSDAARNRAKVLAAAERLFSEHGVESVSMDAVATAAGVGKGTLFRRFGDKAGLAVALLDQRERDLQDAMLFGPAPLGPGAPSAERLRAFVAAYLDYALEYLPLVRMSETASAGARYRIGAYRFWHRHVAILLGAIDGVTDADALSHTLLAPLGAEHLTAMVDELGADRVRRSMATLVSSITTPAPDETGLS